MSIVATEKGLSFEKIPSTPEQDRARDWLVGSYQSDLNFPRQQIAGLSDSQKATQEQIRSYLSGTAKDFSQSQGYYRNMLSSDYNPEDSTMYQGVSSFLGYQKDKDQARVRRTAQKSGASRSTAYLKKEAKTGQVYDTERDNFLTALLQEQRQLKESSATGLVKSRGQELNQLQAADQIAGNERMINQLQLEAAYNQSIQNLLADYNYKAGIAAEVLGETQYLGVKKGGELKNWTSGALLAGAAVAAYFGQYGLAKNLTEQSLDDNGQDYN